MPLVNCIDCKKTVSSAAVACPYCGRSFANGQFIRREIKLKPDGTQVVSAGVMGLGCAAMLIATGIVLTLTGVGAIIGIPLLLFGVVFPFIAPLFGLFTVEQRNVSKDEENRN